MERFFDITLAMERMIGTTDTLAETCKTMGFKPSDITEQDIETLNADLTCCDECGIWVAFYTTEWTEDDREVCISCYNELELEGE